MSLTRNKAEQAGRLGRPSFKSSLDDHCLFSLDEEMDAAAEQEASDEDNSEEIAARVRESIQRVKEMPAVSSDVGIPSFQFPPSGAHFPRVDTCDNLAAKDSKRSSSSDELSTNQTTSASTRHDTETDSEVPPVESRATSTVPVSVGRDEKATQSAPPVTTPTQEAQPTHKSIRRKTESDILSTSVATKYIARNGFVGSIARLRGVVASEQARRTLSGRKGQMPQDSEELLKSQVDMQRQMKSPYHSRVACTHFNSAPTLPKVTAADQHENAIPLPSRQGLSRSGS